MGRGLGGRSKITKSVVLNYIWIAFFIIAFVVALVKLVFLGDTTIFPAMMDSTFETSKSAFEISIGLTGMLALWLGVMKIGERAGLVNLLARVLSPVFVRLFPDIPKGHPATGSIFMNIAANMLGLDNAATPLGLKAMEHLQELNDKKDTATNPMIMFLVLNTSGLTIIPVSIPGIIITSIYQKINLLNRTLLLTLGGVSLLMALVVWGFAQLNAAMMNTVSTSVAAIMLMTIIVGFIIVAMLRKVNVYEAFIDGAKDGFTTAVRIIPYLVAFLVAIGVFRASGAMDWLISAIRWLIGLTGCDTAFVDALPTAIMKPLSGSGARGMMMEAMTHYGPDSFVGRMSCLFQGSTDTTFYILAVYFGSIGVKYTRHAVACGLLADLAGVVAAICSSDNQTVSIL